MEKLDKFIVTCILIAGLGYLAYLGGTEYLKYQENLKTARVVLKSNDGKHELTIKAQNPSDGVWYLDNNGVLRYIDKDGVLYKLVKDIPALEKGTKTGQAFGQEKL